MKHRSALLDEERTYHHGDLRRALINAALDMVREDQNWTFSLREVARRAGVSHNAPYNHFANKRDLLAAVAAAGFLALRERLLAAIAGVKEADQALMKSGLAYVKFGVANPAHYRLMFGSTFPPKGGKRPDTLAEAATQTKRILAEIIDRGAKSGEFDISPKNKKELETAAICAWSGVHGLTMLAIDNRGGPTPLNTDKLAEELTRMFCYGIARPKRSRG